MCAAHGWTARHTVTLSVVCWDFNHKSQQSPNSLYWNSLRKFLIHFLNHLQPTDNRPGVPPVTACLCIFGRCKEVAGSLDLKQSFKILKMRPNRDAAGVLKSCYRNTVPFFIIYFIVEATETNVCASLESHSSVSTSTSPAWQLTQQNASLFHWGWHCQQCSKGICQDGVLANGVVFIGQGFKANQRHHLVALWNHATAIQAGYQATLTTSTVTVDITIGWSSLSIVLYNFKLLYPVYMFRPMYSWRTSDFLLYNTIVKNRTASPPSTAWVALLKRLLVASNASAADRPWDDCWILIFREHR